MARLLLVHGDLVGGERLAREIEALGHHVGRTPTVRAAVALVEESAFELLVVDLDAITHGDDDGLEILVRHTSPRTILLLGGSLQRRRRSMLRPSIASLARPFTRARFYDKIAGMIRHITSR